MRRNYFLSIVISTWTVTAMRGRHMYSVSLQRGLKYATCRLAPTASVTIITVAECAVCRVVGYSPATRHFHLLKFRRAVLWRSAIIDFHNLYSSLLVNRTSASIGREYYLCPYERNVTPFCFLNFVI